MTNKKNIIVQQIIFYANCSDSKGQLWFVRIPKDHMGATVLTDDQYASFVFAPESGALKRHPQGKSTGEDFNGIFTKDVQWIETDREETPHWANGWKTGTKVIFTKNGIVKELIK